MYHMIKISALLCTAGVMTCSSCTTANAENMFNERNGGSTSFRKDKLVKHNDSKMHKNSSMVELTKHQLPSDILEPVIYFTFSCRSQLNIELGPGATACRYKQWYTPA